MTCHVNVLSFYLPAIIFKKIKHSMVDMTLRRQISVKSFGITLQTSVV